MIYYIRRLINIIEINHWVFQRFMALLFCVLIYFVFSYSSLYALVFSLFVISFHFFLGLSAFVDDYIHDNCLFLYVITFIKISILFSLKSIFIVLI